MVTANEIRRAIQDLALSRQPVCIHASLSSFGRVAGGASAVVEAFLSEGCTVLAPTFTYFFEVPSPTPGDPARNGYGENESYHAALPPNRIFSPQASDLSRKEMGAVPAAVLAYPNRRRGNHPLNSFSAIGPLAENLIRDQTPEAVYAPFIQLAKLGGWVVMMGVGLERMTLLHLAERQAGRNLFLRWAKGADGQPISARVGSCSQGFGNFEPVLASVVRTLQVGQSHWQVYPVRTVLELAANAIRQNPDITHCDDAACRRCNDAVRGGPQE